MGVSGAGKSSVGALLAERMGARFIEGDDHHSSHSITKMAGGVPLTDEDRSEWLHKLSSIVGEYRHRDQPMVLACSALKEHYRDLLREGDPQLRFLFLQGRREQLLERVAQREEHFFRGEIMLDSQLRDLEAPSSDEAVVVDITLPTDVIVSAFLESLGKG